MLFGAVLYGAGALGDADILDLENQPDAGVAFSFNLLAVLLVAV